MVATHFKQILKSLDNWWLLGETAEHWVTTTWVKGTWSDSHSTKRKENRFIYRTTATVTHAGIETGSRPNHYTLDHLTLCGKQSYKNLCLFIQALRNSGSWFFGAKIIYCFYYSGTRWRKREVGEKNTAFFTFHSLLIIPVLDEIYLGDRSPAWVQIEF